jgi:outer membrane biosynthesis protein TonB
MSLMTATRFAPPRREASADADAQQKPVISPAKAVRPAIRPTVAQTKPEQTKPAQTKPVQTKPGVRQPEPLRAERPERSERGDRTEPQAAWLSGQNTGLPRKSVNRQQLLRELDGFQRQQFASEARKTVMDVTAREIEGIVTIAAKLRGRYLAKLLDSGTSGRGPVTEGEMREIARCREMYEEARRGVDELKQALEQGEIVLQGMENS